MNHTPPAKGESQDRLSARQFAMLGRFIQERYGIKMPPAKKTMLESRLRRRMSKAGFSSLAEYLEFVFSREGEKSEMRDMVDAVTTNKTDFFREPVHFEILCQKVLPWLFANRVLMPNSTFRVWSAACSTGQEPYTIAMVLKDYAERHGDLRFSILASDLSTKVLQKAYQAIYQEDLIEPVPLRFRQRFFLKSRDRALALVQVSEELRKSVEYRRINLIQENYGISPKMHVIFCRNVNIYFSKENQEKILNRFHRQLVPGGYLFIGHSESLAGLSTPFEMAAPTVYRKRLSCTEEDP